MLLERLSRYLYSSPALLQRHVSRIEKQVALVDPYQCGTVIPVPNDVTNAAQVHTHRGELTIKPSMSTTLKLAAQKVKTAENHNAVEVGAPAEAVSDVQNPAKRVRIEKAKEANSHTSGEAAQRRRRGRRW